MNSRGYESAEGLLEARFDEPTVELFREYLKEIVRVGRRSGILRLSWYDD